MDVIFNLNIFYVKNNEFLAREYKDSYNVIASLKGPRRSERFYRTEEESPY